jgi:tRNA threonylcarbamoyladenosine biosynthesis protein TsaE
LTLIGDRCVSNSRRRIAMERKHGMKACVAIVSASPEETEALAVRIGAAARPGDVIALTGELGAGKTAFVRGLAAGLGIPAGEVASPTFTMVAEYRGPVTLVHVDLYRLTPADVDVLALREYATDTAVTAVEWFERLPAGALDASLRVRIDYAEPGRLLTFEGHGERATRLLAALPGVGT